MGGKINTWIGRSSTHDIDQDANNIMDKYGTEQLVLETKKSPREFHGAWVFLLVCTT